MKGCWEIWVYFCPPPQDQDNEEAAGYRRRAEISVRWWDRYTVEVRVYGGKGCTGAEGVLWHVPFFYCIDFTYGEAVLRYWYHIIHADSTFSSRGVHFMGCVKTHFFVGSSPNFSFFVAFSGVFDKTSEDLFLSASFGLLGSAMSLISSSWSYLFSKPSSSFVFFYCGVISLLTSFPESSLRQGRSSLRAMMSRRLNAVKIFSSDTSPEEATPKLAFVTVLRCHNGITN